MTEKAFVQVDGAQLAYDDAGSGHPLVLVHGGLGDRRMWDGQMDAFARHYRVIRYDQRGYGDSSDAAGHVAFHEDLCDLLRALDIPRAHILGLSFGASVVTDFAVTHPEQVSALIVASPVMGEMTAPTRARIEEADRAGEDGDLDRAVELELQLWIDGPLRRPEDVDGEVRERVRAMNHAAWERADTDAEMVQLDPPARDRLAEILAPVLIVTGALDIPEAQATADLLQREIRSARHVSIPRAAHHPQMEQPALFNDAVLGFLSEV